MAEPVTALPFAPRRGTAGRAGSWWGKAWVRTCEETSLAHEDLVEGRRWSRSGRLGAIAVEPGLAAAVLTTPEGDTLLVRVTVARLEDEQWREFAGEVARAAGHAADLLAGQLTPELVEHADEIGVEVLPGPDAVDGACGCDAWAQPCVHVLALMYQVAWLVDADPFVLLLLRGITRDQLLGMVAGERLDDPDEEERAEMAVRAARILALAEDAPGPGVGLADATVARYDERVTRIIAGTGS